MFNLNCRILIGDISFNFVHEVEIESSVQELTDTALIRQGKKVYVKRAGDWQVKPIYEIIKRGDAVEIYLGYDGIERLEFKGYVRQVHPKVPLEIECEDEMFVLKNKTVTPKVFKGGNVSDVIKHIAPGYTYDIFDSALGGTFAIDRDAPTAVKVLEKIEEVYGLRSFFRLTNGTPILVVGKAYSSESQTGVDPVIYRLNENVVENNLEFVSRNDLQIKIEASSLQANGKKLKAKFTGDKDGDTKSFTVPGLTQTQLEAEAKRLYDNSKVDRFDGDITSFGIPFIQKAATAKVIGTEYEVTETTNYVDSVSTKFGVSGFRRTITLGPKASV